MAATTRKIRIQFAAFSFAASVIAASAGAFADAGHGRGSAIGEPGVKSKVSRTVVIKIQDNFYEPETVEVKKGETIRFVLKNSGELLHEFNIGTASMHDNHQKEMAKMAEHGMLTATSVNHKMMNMDHSKMGMPSMKHDDPNAVLLEPGKSGELIWKFTNNAKLEFACNLPGHYEAGMVGYINFRR